MCSVNVFQSELLQHHHSELPGTANGSTIQRATNFLAHEFLCKGLQRTARCSTILHCGGQASPIQTKVGKPYHLRLRMLLVVVAVVVVLVDAALVVVAVIVVVLREVVVVVDVVVVVVDVVVM